MDDVANWVNGTAIGNVLLLWSILLVVNVPAPFLGLEFESSTQRVSLEPPGWVIPAIWFVLFASMGLARWQLGAAGGDAAWYAMRAIEAFAVWCAAYAYYTLGLAQLTGVSALVYGAAGNILTIIGALVVVLVCARARRGTAWLVAPVIVWVSYATALVAQQWRAGLR